MNTMKKIQVDNNGCKYILFRTDIYFSEYSLAVETDEKGHTDRNFIFEEKRQKALEKKLGCKFIRINTSNAKNGYDLDYEVGNIQTFIDKFKNKKIKKGKEIREKLEMRNKKLEMRSKKLEMRNEKLEIKNKKLRNKNKKFNKQLSY